MLSGARRSEHLDGGCCVPQRSPPPKGIRESVRSNEGCTSGYQGQTRGHWTTEGATKATWTDALQRCESLTGQLHGVVRIADVLARVDPSALSEIGLPGALISRKTAVRSRINTGWLRDRAAMLRANMTFASQACRHAIRLAVAVAVAIELSRLVGFRHDYWVPLTVVIVPQPDLGATFSRGVRRFAGTLVGVGVVTVVLPELHPG